MCQAIANAREDELDGAQQRPPLRFYYGWVMLPLSMAALIASSPGQTFGVSIFNESMRDSLGLTHSQLALAYMLGTLLGAFPISYIGRMMDRHGLRRTMLAAVTLFAGACLATSQAQNWVMLTAGFCLLRMLGPGALAFLSSNTLAFWFERRLGTVEGLRLLGMAAAMALIPALNLWLVGHWGWRGAYVLLGAGVWLCLFPTFYLLFHNRPDDVGQAIDGRRFRSHNAAPQHAMLHASAPLDWPGLTLAESLRTRTFWIVTSGTALFSLTLTAVFFCIMPIFQERGLTEQHAAAMLTVFAICLAAMQLGGGMLADRFHAPRLLVVGVTGLATGIFLLHSASTPLVAQLAGGVLGASQGLFFGATQPLWARYFGRRHLGEIRGALMTIMVASSSLGPLFAGLTKDWLGSFDVALIAFSVAPLPVAVLSLFVGAPTVQVESEPVETLELAASEA